MNRVEQIMQLLLVAGGSGQPGVVLFVFFVVYFHISVIFYPPSLSLFPQPVV